MKTVTEHPVENDPEITLSATTLLGIFFGLVLVCGVFFGFGYSTGRRGNEASSTNIPAANAPDANSAPAASHTPKPSAMESLQPANNNGTPDTNTITESLDEDSTPDNTPSQTPAPAVKSATPTPTPVSKPVASLPVSLPPSTTNAVPMTSKGGSVMVQIAAVTRPEDANALAAALRQRGYSVVVRNESQDKLLHVQVGPFASRDDAAAMRSKLLADGYNAILKP